MVMGPTPPGTGVMHPATSTASSKRHVPAQTVVRAIDADVDDGGARRDPVAPDLLRPADGRHQYVGGAAQAGQVAGAGVRDGDGAVAVERAHRLGCRR